MKIHKYSKDGRLIGYNEAVCGAEKTRTTRSIEDGSDKYFTSSWKKVTCKHCLNIRKNKINR